MSSTDDPGVVYRATRMRLTALLLGLPDECGRLVVPAVLPPALVLGCPFAVELECAVLPVLE